MLIPKQYFASCCHKWSPLKAVYLQSGHFSFLLQNKIKRWLANKKFLLFETSQYHFIFLSEQQPIKLTFVPSHHYILFLCKSNRVFGKNHLFFTDFSSNDFQTYELSISQMWFPCAWNFSYAWYPNNDFHFRVRISFNISSASSFSSLLSVFWDIADNYPE